MKLYRQGKREIRIRLTNKDLEDFAITVEELDYDSPRGRRVIRALFDKAKEELGFDAAGEKIYIQLYPTGRGECDLFITKLEREPKPSCFLFSDFDSFFATVSHASSPVSVDLWQEKKSGRFNVLTNEKETPPLFPEFGERVKIPSQTFLRSRCRKMHWEERKSNGSKQN